MFISIFKNRSFNSKNISYSCDVKVSCKKDDSNNDGNDKNKKSKEKLTISKSENLIKSKKIAKNGIIRFKL